MSDCFGDCEQRELKNKILRLEAEIAELEECEQQWGEKWISERKENERLREALVELEAELADRDNRIAELRRYCQQQWGDA